MNAALWRKCFAAMNRIEKSNQAAGKELQDWLAAMIDPRLTVNVLGRGLFEYEVAVGYDGSNNYTPGKRFRFGIDRESGCPFVGDLTFCRTADDPVALAWLHEIVAAVAQEYFWRHPDRVRAVVEPLRQVRLRARLGWLEREAARIEREAARIRGELAEADGEVQS
jgi:hypothetical protein